MVRAPVLAMAEERARRPQEVDQQGQSAHRVAVLFAEARRVQLIPNTPSRVSFLEAKLDYSQALFLQAV